MPPVAAEQLAALEHDYRFGSDRLVRQRSHIVLLAYELDTRPQIARVVRCSATTVRRTLSLWAHGGRSLLVRRPSLAHVARRTLAWQKELARAMDAGPEACGVPRPTWSAPLLARYLAQVTGVAVSERTVRRGLATLGYRLGRPTWSVRHKAEEEADFAPKRPGWKRS
jgi:transposase